jgi:hypothetical protein
MATLTNEQIEAKKQQLKQLAEEAEKLKNELVEAGAWPLDEDELDQAAGGCRQVRTPGGCRQVRTPGVIEDYKPLV